MGGTDICLCSQEVPLVLSLGSDQGIWAVPWGQVSCLSTGWRVRVGCTCPRMPAEEVSFASHHECMFIMTTFRQPPGAAADEGGTGGPSPRGLQVGQKLLVQFFPRSSSGVSPPSIWSPVMGSVFISNGLQPGGVSRRVSTCHAPS